MCDRAGAADCPHAVARIHRSSSTAPAGRGARHAEPVLDDISDLVFRPALRAAGITDDELRRLRAQRRLTVVRRGAYVPSADRRLDDAVARHALTVRAAIRTMSPHAVVSHVSAAALHGLVLWDVPLDRVHVTRNRCSGGRRTTVLHVHTAGLDVDEVVEVDGVAVTSVPRTLADLARTLPFEQALVVADAALHGHRTTPAAFAEAVARAAGREGSPPARRVVAAADPRAESPGETRSRVAIARARIPPPVLQHDVPELGVRTDFYWEEFRTVGEFDGKAKYGRDLRPGQDPGEAVYREKRREDALRDLGLQVVRWTWDELSPFDAPAARLRRAFARS
jgi:hypothetical protein